MKLVAKKQPGGALGRHWDHPDQAIEVSDEEADALLRLPNGPGGFYLVEFTPFEEPDGEEDLHEVGDPDGIAEVTPLPEIGEVVPRRRGRPPKVQP